MDINVFVRAKFSRSNQESGRQTWPIRKLEAFSFGSISARTISYDSNRIWVVELYRDQLMELRNATRDTWLDKKSIVSSTVGTFVSVSSRSRAPLFLFFFLHSIFVSLFSRVEIIHVSFFHARANWRDLVNRVSELLTIFLTIFSRAIVTTVMNTCTRMNNKLGKAQGDSIYRRFPLIAG